MALAVDAVSGTFWTSNESQSSVTWSHTCAGDNRILVVLCAVSGGAEKVSGVTYNGTALTNVWDAAKEYLNTSGWVLVAPASGAHDVVVSFATNTSGWTDQGCCAISFTGAHQTTPIGTAVTANNYSDTPSATVTTGSGEIVVDCVRAGGVVTVGADQTERYVSGKTIGFSTQPGENGGVMSWSQTKQLWAIGAVPIKPAASSGLSIPIVQAIYRRRRM